MINYKTITIDNIYMHCLSSYTDYDSAIIGLIGSANNFGKEFVRTKSNDIEPIDIFDKNNREESLGKLILVSINSNKNCQYKTKIVLLSKEERNAVEKSWEDGAIAQVEISKIYYLSLIERAKYSIESLKLKLENISKIEKTIIFGG